MHASRAVKLVASALLASSLVMVAPTAHAAVFKSSGFVAGNHIVTEDPSPEPSSTEQSEAAKQATEKAREAAKKAAEAAKKAAERAKKAADKLAKSGQLQLPPLIIRPAEPNDKVSEDDSNDDDSGTPVTAPTSSPAATSDPSVTANGASTGKKKFYTKPTQGAQNTGASTLNGSTTSGQSASGQSGDAQSTQNGSSVTYVLSPLGDDGAATSGMSTKSVKAADPTANEPIRVVAGASSKTPADEFFQLAGFGILALGVGAGSLIGVGVYRAFRLRRSSNFDFEYRS